MLRFPSIFRRTCNLLSCYSCLFRTSPIFYRLRCLRFGGHDSFLFNNNTSSVSEPRLPHCLSDISKILGIIGEFLWPTLQETEKSSPWDNKMRKNSVPEITPNNFKLLPCLSTAKLVHWQSSLMFYWKFKIFNDHFVMGKLDAEEINFLHNYLEKNSSVKETKSLASF